MVLLENPLSTVSLQKWSSLEQKFPFHFYHFREDREIYGGEIPQTVRVTLFQYDETDFSWYWRLNFTSCFTKEKYVRNVLLTKNKNQL